MTSAKSDLRRESSMGTSTSTRRSRLRGIRSALPIQVVVRSLVWNDRIRLCSRKRPSTLRTVILSLRPGTPGRSMQIPRVMISTLTPAVEAAYSASITSGSTRELILIRIRPPSPARAARTTRSTSFKIPSRRNQGPTSSLRNTAGRVLPVTALNTSATSAAMSSSAVKRPRSS